MQQSVSTTRSVPVERRTIVTSHAANGDVANGNVDVSCRCVKSINYIAINSLAIE